ncbi:hypothetical protein RIEGSTA812A_PEG_743 [invertebrate metagenome]|uniref:Uncharacterized protein n=1 Tax=invertebrate metagenome TaxID=1711999 RepID=A0A484H6Z0_9ZZZZ
MSCVDLPRHPSTPGKEGGGLSCPLAKVDPSSITSSTL